MDCCLTAPSHYLKQCRLMISGVLWHSPDNNFTENTQDINCWNEFEIYLFETIVKSPRGQWINIQMDSSNHEQYMPSWIPSFHPPASTHLVFARCGRMALPSSATKPSFNRQDSRIAEGSEKTWTNIAITVPSILSKIITTVNPPITYKDELWGFLWELKNCWVLWEKKFMV